MVINFEIGDLVRIEETEYARYSKGVMWNENVFSIMEIIGAEVKLSYLDETIPLNSIEPIPIDGKADACIYYNPAFMAGIGETIIVHEIDTDKYFIDGFEQTYINGHTLKDEFLAKRFKYVHEVQHWLKENGSRDELRVNYTLKTT